MPVLPETEAALAARMSALGIKEDDLLEKFVRASGPGGQKVNKTSSAVYLKHLPTGLEVKAQESRSQAMNRFLARRILVERLERERLGKASAEQQRIEKIRRQKRKRSRRSKARMLADKRHHSAKKDARRGPSE
jgi:protein subunit release factor B